MKKITLILAMLLMASVFASCSKEDAKNDAPDTSVETKAETDAPETDEPETTAPETASPETEAPETETDPPAVEPVTAELPKQGDVPCDMENTLDLSDDILVADFLLQENGGQWVLGDDNTQMTNMLTEDLLKEYKYFAFTYTCDDCDVDSQIALMCKFVHEDGTKSEILCEDWFGWGPADMTYHASSFAVMNVYGESGVFYVPTESLLAHEAFRDGDVIDQIGLAGVEYTGTYVNLSVTGAYLTK